MENDEGNVFKDQENLMKDDVHNMEQIEDNIFSDTPAQVDKHLEFIKFNGDGHLILGSSNLTGRYWGGSLFYFSKPKLAPNVEDCNVGLEFTSGIIDAAWLSKNRLVVGQDGGVLQFLSIDYVDDNYRISKLETIDDLDHSVVSIEVSCDKKTILTASMDMGIRLWDSATTLATYNFQPAHTQEVTDISPHPVDPKIFISSSLDGNVLLWDLRCPKPASCIFRDVDDPPTSVCFCTKYPNSYLVGCSSGKLGLRTTKTISHSIQQSTPFKRSIFRIEPNPYSETDFALCADDTKVVVVTLDEKPTEIRKSYIDDEKHDDYVRGLAWQDNTTLFSCGWDKKVFIHHLEK